MDDEQDEFDEQDEEDEFDDEDYFDEQNERVRAIIGTRKLDVTEAVLQKFLVYLKQHIELPCQLTGSEDFGWEERYVFGHGSQKEYAELKKTRASYRDIFNLLDFEEDITDAHYGLLVNVRRAADRRKFTLPLADLKATDESSKNYELLDDYAVWFVNYR